MVEAAEILGVTDRSFRRLSTSYESDGVAGLQDRRLDRASAQVAGKATVSAITYMNLKQ